MDASFVCPVCDGDDWETIHAYRYGKTDKTCSDGGPITPYHELRRSVLFEVWFPGADEVVIESLLCRRCGFMCYSPRPSAADIDAKYRFLQSTEKDIGGQKQDKESIERDRKRAARVFEIINRHKGGGSHRILDVGGGNGKLLLPFMERGHDCSLVDYNLNPIEGVRKIADQLEDVPADATYDIVICSHVMEHLAEPARALRQMAGHLSKDGLIYGEVPLGVWGGIGIENDPVTHVNFFTKASYETLFHLAGMRVLDARQTVGIYNRRIDVVYVVAAKGDGLKTSFPGNPDDARRLLNQSFWMKLTRMWRLRLYPWT